MPFEKRKIIDFDPPSLLNVYVTYIGFLKEGISDYEASTIEKDAKSDYEASSIEKDAKSNYEASTIEKDAKSNYEASTIEKDAKRNSRYRQDRAAIWLNDYNMNQESSITNEARKTFFDNLYNMNQESSITNEARKTFFDNLKWLGDQSGVTGVTKENAIKARNDIIRIQAQAFTSFLCTKCPIYIGDSDVYQNEVSEQQAYHIFKDDKEYTHFEINFLTKLTEIRPSYSEVSYYLDNNGGLKGYVRNFDPEPEIGAYPFDMYQHLDLKFCWQKKSDLVSKIENIREDKKKDKSTSPTSQNLYQLKQYEEDINSLNEFIEFLSGTHNDHPYHLQTRTEGDVEEVFFPEIYLKQSLSYDKYKPETEYLDLSIDPNGTEFNEIKFYKSIVATLSNILDKGGVEEIKENVVRQIKDLFLLNMKRDLEKNYYSSDIDYLNQMDEVIEQIKGLVEKHEIDGLEFDINDMKYCIDAAFLPNDSDTPADRNRKLSYLRKSVIDEDISPNRASFQAALNVRQDYKDAKTNTNIIKYTTLFLSTLFFILAFLPLMTPLGPAGIATATIFSLATVATLIIGFKAYSQREQLLQGPQARWNFIKATRSDEFERGSYKAIPQASFGGIIPNKGLKMD